MLRASEPGDGGLVLDGEPLTVERIKLAISQAFMDARLPRATTSSSRWGDRGRVGHDTGSGPDRPPASRS